MQCLAITILALAAVLWLCGATSELGGHTGVATDVSAGAQGLPLQIAANHSKPADDGSSDGDDDDQPVLIERIQPLIGWRFEAWVTCSEPRQLMAALATASGRGPPSLL